MAPKGWTRHRGGLGRWRLPGHPGTFWPVNRIALVVVAAVVLGSRPAAAQCPDGSPPPCGRAAPAPRNSVAVLTFRALSRDTADAYIAEGLSDLISTRLQQVQRLVIKSRSQVRSRETARAAGAFFGAAYLLTGTVLRSASRLQVTAELARAATGDVVWSERYERDDGNALSVEADIAGQVAGIVLGGRLRAAERTALDLRPTADGVAYDHFIRGNVLLLRRTATAVAAAIAEYEAAAARDSSFTAAIGRAAYAYALFLVWGWGHPALPREHLLEAGLRASDRALLRDSTTSDAWMARGYLLSVRDPRTMQGVAEVFDRALRLDNRNAEAHHQYGAVLRLMGRDVAAVRELRRALELDPDRAISLLLLAEVEIAAGNVLAAERLLDSAAASGTANHSTYLTRARLRASRGDHAGARADADAGRARSGGDEARVLATEAFVAAHAGDTARARATLAGAAAAAGPSGLDPQTATMLAMAQVAVGEREHALATLERCTPRAARLWFYLRWSEFDSIRGDPRFAALVAEARPPAAVER